MVRSPRQIKTPKETQKLTLIERQIAGKLMGVADKGHPFSGRTFHGD